MFMLFGLEKKALLLVFVLLLARTAHFETLNSERTGCTRLALSPGSAQLGLGHHMWCLSSAELTYKNLDSAPALSSPSLHSNMRLVLCPFQNLW